MSSPSNLYAEKIFSEHPRSLWALDDKADYISLIDEVDRDISEWTISGGTAEVFTDVSSEPFIDSITTKLIGNLPSGDSGQIEVISDDIINFTALNSYMATFSIGTYLYSLSPYISGIEIGYEYYDTTTGTNIQRLKNYNTSISDQWIFVSETFNIPAENTTLRLVLKINYIGGASSTDDYHFLINGLSFGQWSEEFNSSSLGSDKIVVPSSIAIPTSFGIRAEAYGLEESPGYYLISDNSLVAKNTGIPLVYGASNVTTLTPNGDNPSLIIPGYGFLNKVGQYKEYTLEMWLRINSDATIKKRICGPIGSDDGLYVDGPFILLKIDDNYQSHYIGEWARPMLIDIRVTSNAANLLINGEQVISLNYITSELSLPDKLNAEGYDQDWIGFYAYQDVSPIDIDCVAIYPYQVPSLVAKKRFVYGQGVEIPENINTAYSGTSVFIDYPFADYTNNYMYPDIGKWNQATVDNLSTERNVLSVPQYSLPTITFNNKTEQNLLTDCAVSQNESNLFITFRPAESWDSTEGYMYFDSLNPIKDDTAAFYGVFKIFEYFSTPQTLIRIEDENSGNYFSIDITNDQIDYTLNYNNTAEVIYSSLGVQLNHEFGVGININDFSLTYGSNVLSFFGNRSSLRAYVGGNKNLNQTFMGNIYTVGFCSPRNYSTMSFLFNQYGLPVDYENLFDLYSGIIDFDGGEDPQFWDYVLDGGEPDSFLSDILLDHVASYTLKPKQYFDDFVLDIDVQGYWEDHIPLTYFAQFVTDAKNNQYYDLDFIQFNINYPAPATFLESETTGSWTYAELQSAYSNPIQRTYESLDNHLFTGYNDYSDLQNRSSKTYSYDTTNSLVRSYVTFQYLQSGANAVSGYFTTIEPAPKNGIVDPGSTWINTKYEVVDNMLIYPPKGVDFNDVAIVTHLDFVVRGILHNPIKIRRMQYASQAFNDSSPNPVGTRFGIPLYPYKKSGFYYDYKSQNPFTIYKGSSPYLYLTRNSGIQLKGIFDPLVNRGVSIPINSEKSSNYKVMAMQAAVRFDEDFFPYSPTQIFEIESRNQLIKFYMVANHPDGKRAKIYAINANTGQIENGIGFYWNGNIVKEPSITIKEWGFLGISFSSLLNFNNTVGSIKINGPLLVNLVSHYQSTNLQEVQTITTRPWFKVKYSGPLALDWQYWNSAYIWNGVLVLSSTSYYGVRPSDIYKAYSGTNKIIVDDYSPSDPTPKILLFNDYEYSVYSDITWQTNTLNAV